MLAPSWWRGVALQNLLRLRQKTRFHRLIKTQIGHARDFAWYRGQRPSPARVILSHERVQIHARENLWSYATNPPHCRVRELLLCDILITRVGDGRWLRYQAKSLACPGCARFARLLPPADSRAFGARYSRFALVTYFSQTVLNRVFDKDYN